MSIDIDVPLGTDPQEPGEFPGHCDYCGELCQVCATHADQGDVPHD